jgi:hypothetical protein
MHSHEGRKYSIIILNRKSALCPYISLEALEHRMSYLSSILRGLLNK